MKTTQEEVHRLLLETTRLRDCDMLLSLVFWNKELKKMNFDIKKKTAEELMLVMYQKKLTKQSTIQRCRRLVNEMNEETRGLSWKLGRKLEPEVRQELKQIKENK